MRGAAAVVLALPAVVARAPLELTKDLPLSCQSVSVGADRSVVLSAVEPSAARLPPHTAIACFQDGLLVNGWGQLQVATASAPAKTVLASAAASAASARAAPSSEQLLREWYGAGVVEAMLTGHRIAENFPNTFQVMFKGVPVGGMPPHIADFMQQQYQFATKLASASGQTSLQLKAVLAQFQGMIAGLDLWRKAHPQQEELFKNASSWDVMTVINGVGDLLDISNFVKGSLDEIPQEETLEELKERLTRRGLCSALFRALPDLSDIVMGHASWFDFSHTNRVFKHYSLPSLPLQGGPARPVTMSFSSYAGMLVSLDDFYMMSSGLVMIQTSLGVVDKTVYNESKSDALLAWHRVRLANAMAETGDEWGQLIKDYNSGTYNNEYMVLNLNLFKSGQPLPDKLFTVVNQVPGLVAWEDATRILRYGYFPSYNVPFVRAAYVKAGYLAAVEKFGDTELSYDLAPRGTVFRRDALRVVNVDTLKQVLGSNDYLHDPLAKGDPTKQICARGDLPGVGPAAQRKTGAFGCYDLKATSASLARQQRAEALNGPTRGGAADGSNPRELPAFFWEESAATRAAPHVGLPAKYDFGFVSVSPWLLSAGTAGTGGAELVV